MLVSGGVGLATVAALQEMSIKHLPDLDDYMLHELKLSQHELTLAYVAILIACAGFLVIGLVGVISNSLLLHGTNKVCSNRMCFNDRFLTLEQR